MLAELCSSVPRSASTAYINPLASMVLVGSIEVIAVNCGKLLLFSSFCFVTVLTGIRRSNLAPGRAERI
jgi:hypothetical protein